MASAELDPLLLLRQSIAADSTNPATPIASDDASAPEAPLLTATHLRFRAGDATLPLDAPTRFVTGERAVDLRSIYFAWLNRELAIPAYAAAASSLNHDLAASAQPTASVRNLAFVERVELLTWLEGASEENEHIRPLADAAGAAPGAAAGATGGAAGAGGAGGVAAGAGAGLSRSGKGTLDPRLAGILGGERKTGDRNTALRGIRPTDFSHVRKQAAPLIQQRKSQTAGATHGGASINQSLALNQKPARRPDPIILLSPSASSLLRMSNARSFLESGRFTPPDSAAAASNMLHVNRRIGEVDATRDMRFILVEGTEQFKPEYWNRVVAVFTTGQPWQFKSYKWSVPAELFARVQGIYVGWRGEAPPQNVRDWGHRVLAVEVDRWRETGVETMRFRDVEVVEHIWKVIAANMLHKGWKRDAAPAAL